MSLDPMTRHLWPLLLTCACDPNFTVSRGDLGPFRIAGVGVTTAADGSTVASAALWSGLGLYHEVSPTLRWTLDGQELGEGYDVAVPGEGTLGLTATDADGTSLTAVVTVAAPPPPTRLSRAAVTLESDLSLEARRAAPAVEVADTVEEGEVARLSLAFEPVPETAYTASWLMAGGLGTALEVEDTAADLFAEEITWEDGEVAERLPDGPGVYHSLALIRDGAGSNAWVWADAAFGAPGAYLRHEGRLLPLDQADGATVATEAASAGWARATLIASEDAAGVALTDAAAVPEVDGQPDLSAQDALSCAPADQPFRLAWLAEGRCALSDVIGATVLLEVW